MKSSVKNGNFNDLKIVNECVFQDDVLGFLAKDKAGKTECVCCIPKKEHYH